MKRTMMYGIGLVAAMLFGGVTTGVAMASIPDGSGVVHGCYNAHGALRVIDTATTASCAGSETALDWNQTGPVGPAGPQGPAGAQGPAGPAGGPVAYLHVLGDGTMDPANSKNIASVLRIVPPADTGGADAFYCITMTVSAHVAIASTKSYGASTNIWQVGPSEIYKLCPAGTNVQAVQGNGSSGFDVVFF